MVTHSVNPRRNGGSKGEQMGQPVVHFEVIGTDAEQLQRFYAELFDWEIDADNPLKYGSITPQGNDGITGGIASAPTADYPGHVTFYVGVPDVEAALAKAESLGATRLFGPAPVPGTEVELGQFTDPEGHLIGVMRST
jgi:predicted enzyme related to lactoylglutathione lyase